MAYPTLTWIAGSTITRRSGHKVDVAEDGTVYTRTTFTADVRELHIMHLLNQTDRDDFMTWYGSNKNAKFQIDLPTTGETIWARCTSAPDGVDLKVPELGQSYRVTIDLVEVPA